MPIFLPAAKVGRLHVRIGEQRFRGVFHDDPAHFDDVAARGELQGGAEMCLRDRLWGVRGVLPFGCAFAGRGRET